ncbi:MULTISPECIES: hypothetical protein [Maribacter]|uniref:Uncharacterized protein n=1 Tax=Maribacter flavus TaxID=1658664 RepID=A0ABU7IFZ2_9FLAO|nr:MULTISPECIES: hypothetical protein [Maribacter]MDC6404598.1 hypothetical protein [Maribacter sp. PR66]MEE1971741.1 hypothetical protein [Maribacter flavus]
MIRTFLFLLSLTFFSCTNYGQLKVVTDLPSSLKENSGMVSLKDSTVWIIEDGGNKDELYKVDFKGNILKTLKMKNGDNDDWEDLTKDSLGNVYIADIGNNNNSRKNLKIYKVPNPEIEPGDKIDAEKIELSYPNQKEFPPKKSGRYFDAEAIFHHNNKLFIVTKNRANPFTGSAYIYSVPDQKGVYEANLVGEINVCKDWKTCQITGIAISPSGKKIIALSYGKLFIFTDFTWDNFSNGKIEEIDLGIRTQLESICFLNEDLILLSDERSHGTGNNLYSLDLSKVKIQSPDQR